MKIGILVKNFQPPWNEGVKNNIRVICQGLKAMGHEVFFLSVSDQDGERLLEEGRSYLIKSPMYRTPLRYLWYPLGFLRLFLKGKGIIRRERPEVFLVSFGSNALLAAGLRAFSGVPFKIVQFLYNDWYSRQKVPAKVFLMEHLTQCLFNNRLLTQASVRHCDTVIATAGYLAERIRALASAKTRVEFIPNGVDTQHYAPGPRSRYKEKLVIGFIGHLTHSKGFGVLKAALESLEPGLDIRLVAAISHTGAESRAMEGVRSLPIPVEILGTVEQSDFYRSVDVVIYPLRYPFGTIAYPNIVLETMASGRVIVVTDLPGTREIVESGKNGILLKSPESAQVRQALLDLYRDEPLRRRIGAQARETALQRYQWPALIEKIESSLHPEKGEG
jgi:glycosyltransferase involved in cell wall biosynthesis